MEEKRKGQNKPTNEEVKRKNNNEKAPSAFFLCRKQVDVHLTSYTSPLPRRHAHRDTKRCHYAPVHTHRHWYGHQQQTKKAVEENMLTHTFVVFMSSANARTQTGAYEKEQRDSIRVRVGVCRGLCVWCLRVGAWEAARCFSDTWATARETECLSSGHL